MTVPFIQINTDLANVFIATGTVAAAIAAFGTAFIGYKSLKTSERVADLTVENVKMARAVALATLAPMVQKKAERIVRRHKEAFNECERVITEDGALIEACLAAHHRTKIGRPIVRRIKVTHMSPMEITSEDLAPPWHGDTHGEQGIVLSFDCWPLDRDLGNQMEEYNELVDNPAGDVPRFGVEHVIVQSQRLYDRLWAILLEANEDLHALRNLVYPYGADDLALAVFENDWRVHFAYQVMLTGFKAPPLQIRTGKLRDYRRVRETLPGVYYVDNSIPSSTRHRR